MNSELFVELSDEQQQLVAGGQLDNSDVLSTYYTQDQSATTLATVQASGPGGSANVQDLAIVSRSINTGADRDFNVSI
jgi:hypothetical protein